MNTCDTCKHYDGKGECSHPKIMQPSNMQPGYLYEEGPANPPENSAVVTGYDDRACLWVGPKFGCIHHEPKNDSGA
jgi:hypothetical protein